MGLMEKRKRVIFYSLIEQYEVKLIDWAMSQAKGNITKAAYLLHLNRTTLQTKVAKYGIDKEIYKNK